MMMRRAALLLLAASLAILPPPPAHALQLAGLFMGKLDPIQGHYRSGNRILASAIYQRDHTPQDAYRDAMTKIGEMALAKGFERVGVTKIADCGRLFRNGSPTPMVACRVLAQMVGPDEAAKPEGKREVVYYSAVDMAAGKVRLDAN
jgi:hypothetical protein